MTKICRGCAAQIPNCLHCFCPPWSRIKFNLAESRWSSVPWGQRGPSQDEAKAPATNHTGALVRRSDQTSLVRGKLF